MSLKINSFCSCNACLFLLMCLLLHIILKIKKFCEKLIAYFPCIWNGPHSKRSLCIRWSGNCFAEPLPRKDSGIQIKGHRQMEGYLEHTVETDSDAVMKLPNFTKCGSRIRNLVVRNINAQRAWWSHKSTFILLKWKTRLKPSLQCNEVCTE
jgi:hypothetical protein